MGYFFRKIYNFLRKIVEKFQFIKIDLSFFALAIYAFLSENFRMYFLFIIFMILHELSHVAVARKLGYLPAKVRLSFFGAKLEGFDDFSAGDEIKVIFAGPLFNLCICVICFLCFWFWPESYNFLNDILTVNLSLFVFNMLPIFPLDFGRVLLVLFSKKVSRKTALKIVKNISVFMILILFLVFLISAFFEFNLLIGISSINLFFMATNSASQTSFKRSLFFENKLKKIKSGLIQKCVYVSCNCNNIMLFRHIDGYHLTKFIFVDEKGRKVSEMNEIELIDKLTKI
ncbi:MAG: hypothetical protein IJ538_04740 [Clostridia bacterium]|nr:hypothetical protein [Clostridia bacterium]